MPAASAGFVFLADGAQCAVDHLDPVTGLPAGQLGLVQGAGGAVVQAHGDLVAVGGFTWPSMWLPPKAPPRAPSTVATAAPPTAPTPLLGAAALPAAQTSTMAEQTALFQFRFFNLYLL